MSERIVNDITLKYLSNVDVSRSVQKETEKKNQPMRKDKKFYKKRILDMAKKLISPDKDNEDITLIPIDLKTSFDFFAHRCVEYFKTLDTNEILQQDYEDLEEKKPQRNVESKSQAYADELFVKSIQVKQPSSLDSFVVRTKVAKKEDTTEYPQKKELKLRTDELKTKGVAKKNLRNTYEEASKNNRRETKKTSKDPKKYDEETTMQSKSQK